MESDQDGLDRPSPGPPPGRPDQGLDPPMGLQQAVRKRRMVRNFAPDPIPSGRLDLLLDTARRAPSAGNVSATGFVVLDDPDAVATYWDTTLPDPHRREAFTWQGLLRAPALVIVTTKPEAYPARYRESDKAATGRGDGIHRWPVPYWWVDAGAVIQNILLLAVDAGWGACLFGPFDHEPALQASLGISSDTRLVGTIALGYPLPDARGRSSGRPRPDIDQVISRPGQPPSG